MKNEAVMHGGEELPVQSSDALRLSPELADRAPTLDDFTPYDEAHFAVYLSLLHASAEGTSADEMCRNILRIDSAEEPVRAAAMLQSHLERARWLAANGHQLILEDDAIDEARP